MEDEHNVKGREFRACYGESETDEYGVEDDSKLEYEYGSHLRCVVLGRLVLTHFNVMINVLARMTEMVIAWCVAARNHGSLTADCKVLRSFRRRVKIPVVMNMLGGVFMGVAVTEGRKAHGHEFREEEYEDRHQRDTFGPVILSDYTSKAWIRKRIAGGCKELDSVSLKTCKSIALSNLLDVILTCMKAVAMMTPDPKYFAMKKAH